MCIPILKRIESLQLVDYQEVLGLNKGYVISQMSIHADNWMVNRTLKELNLSKEGTRVLMVLRRKGFKEDYIVPYPDLELVTVDIPSLIDDCPPDCIPIIVGRDDSSPGGGYEWRCDCDSGGGSSGPPINECGCPVYNDERKY